MRVIDEKRVGIQIDVVNTVDQRMSPPRSLLGKILQSDHLNYLN